MKIIAHRGNTNGPHLYLENEPSYIDKAIEKGFDVEIDIRCVDGSLYLGHDDPEHPIGLDWLLDRKESLWVHCKNLAAAHFLSKHLRCFCSISDPFCFITLGFLWLNDKRVEPTENTVVPLLSKEEILSYPYRDKAFAICTDWPKELQNV